MTSEPQLSGRLHPAALALAPLRAAGPLALLVVTGSVTAGLRRAAVVLVVAAGLSVLVAVARWARFTWAVTADAVVIEQGLVSRRRRVIPLARVQGVDLVRTLAHRLLGVVEVRIEAIGDDRSEGRLEALAPDVAAAVRDLVLARTTRPGPAPPEASEGGPGVPPAPPLVRVGPGRLVVSGLTGGRVGVAAALLGLAEQLLGDRVDEAVEGLAGLGPALLAALAVVAAVGVFTASVVATIASFWGFQVRAEPGALTITRGLLEQRHDTIPLRRLQGVEIRENWLRRLLGLAMVRVVVAGRAGTDEAARTTVLLPLGTRGQAHRLAGLVLGAPEVVDAALAPMPPAARRRRRVRALAVVVVATGALVAWRGPLGLLGLAAVPVALGLADAAYRALGHARTPRHVLARHGVLVRTTSIVGIRKLQSLRLRQTVFQRRLDVADLELQVPISGGAGTPVLHDLDAAVARRWLDRLAAEAVGADARPGVVVVGPGFEPG